MLRNRDLTHCTLCGADRGYSSTCLSINVKVPVSIFAVGVSAPMLFKLVSGCTPKFLENVAIPVKGPGVARGLLAGRCALIQKNL